MGGEAPFLCEEGGWEEIGFMGEGAMVMCWGRYVDESASSTCLSRSLSISSLASSKKSSMTILFRNDLSPDPSGNGRNCGMGLIGMDDGSSPGDNDSSPPVDILFLARFLKCEKKDDFGELDSSLGLPVGEDDLSGPVGTLDAAESCRPTLFDSGSACSSCCAC
jgi:hypothetical protein